MLQIPNDKGAWLVEAGSVCDPSTGFVSVKTRDLALPFVAMIDAVRPSVSFAANAGGPMPAGQTIFDTATVSDNVFNASAKYSF